MSTQATYFVSIILYLTHIYFQVRHEDNLSMILIKKDSREYDHVIVNKYICKKYLLMKKKFKQWLLTVLPISTKWAISNLWPQIIAHKKRQRQKTLEIQVPAWNMLKNVAELNQWDPNPLFVLEYLFLKLLLKDTMYMEKAFISLRVNCISGVMVSVLASSVVDRMFDPRSGQTKDCKIGICCFSA